MYFGRVTSVTSPRIPADSLENDDLFPGTADRPATTLTLTADRVLAAERIVRDNMFNEIVPERLKCSFERVTPVSRSV